MNKEFKEIVNEYEKFKTYLEKINIQDFEKYERLELIELQKAIRNIDSFRYLCLELDSIINKKKKEEFPEILGVHHFPKLKEIDFLEEQDKIKIDNFLVTLGRNNYFGYYFGGSRGFSELLNTLDNKNCCELLLNFLVDNQMVSYKHYIYVCCERVYYTDEQIKDILEYSALKENCTDWDKFYELESKIESYFYCENCEEETDLPIDKLKIALNEPLSKCLFKMSISRDTTFDKV